METTNEILMDRVLEFFTRGRTKAAVWAEAVRRLNLVEECDYVCRGNGEVWLNRSAAREVYSWLWASK